MGLDVVELVMEVEEAFGVVIPDQEAEKILTVGDLHRWLLRQLGIRASGPCLSSVTFYRVRRALMSLGVARSGIRLRTELRELLLEGNRQW